MNKQLEIDALIKRTREAKKAGEPPKVIRALLNELERITHSRRETRVLDGNTRYIRTRYDSEED